MAVLKRYKGLLYVYITYIYANVMRGGLVCEVKMLKYLCMYMIIHTLITQAISNHTINPIHPIHKYIDDIVFWKSIQKWIHFVVFCLCPHEAHMHARTYIHITLIHTCIRTCMHVCVHAFSYHTNTSTFTNTYIEDIYITSHTSHTSSERNKN